MNTQFLRQTINNHAFCWLVVVSLFFSSQYGVTAGDTLHDRQFFFLNFHLVEIDMYQYES